MSARVSASMHTPAPAPATFTAFTACMAAIMTPNPALASRAGVSIRSPSSPHHSPRRPARPSRPRRFHTAAASVPRTLVASQDREHGDEEDDRRCQCADDDAEG
ncbi:hypothetical protein EDC01DRAFT_632303 [Geopyxis carbonaria]|nr:hypothetical protein EDC01DRAFT_632303 [Geopyxis carbonaria]